MRAITKREGIACRRAMNNILTGKRDTVSAVELDSESVEWALYALGWMEGNGNRNYFGYDQAGCYMASQVLMALAMLVTLSGIKSTEHKS